MKYIDEFRNHNLTKALAHKIHKQPLPTPITLMEVCGTHTMSIARFGIKKLLPSNIRLLSGPGCPVCVTPTSYIDTAIELSRRKNITIATFGDLMRVPSSNSSLEIEKAKGSDIRVVYSPLQALELAQRNPQNQTIFLSIGFETTTSPIAATILEAKKRKISNFYLLTSNKTIPTALQALLNENSNIDGFILPGHVSTIIGSDAYSEIAEKFHTPCCIAGFEPTDILDAILDLITQISQGVANVSVQYRRAVTCRGNTKAKEIINQVFMPYDAEWRGLGTIQASGLKLNEEFAAFDAEYQFSIEVKPTKTKEACICGLILKGLKTPMDCNLFGKQCTPNHPYGACMVSSEGTCAAWYKYGQAQ